MPIKFISSIILIAIVGIFCGFNWGEESQCSINFIFYKTPKIPVFLTIICSFLLGMIVMATFTFSKKFSKKEENKKESKKAEKAENVEEKVNSKSETIDITKEFEKK